LTSNTSHTDFRGYNGELVENAQKNILEKFSVIGITEEYDKFISQLNNTFGWNIQYYAEKAVTKSRPRINEIPKDTLSTIEKYNQMDIELYDFVKNRIATNPASQINTV